MPDFAFLADPTIGAKIVTMLLLGLGSVAMGVAPLKVARWLRIRRPGVPTPCGYPHADVIGAPPLMSLLLCFSGGVLLYTTLLHLQPQVRINIAQQKNDGWLPAVAGVQHLGDLLFCVGFLVVFAVDEVVHAMVDRYAVGSRATEGGDRVPLHRSASMRRRPVCAPRPAPRMVGEEDIFAIEAVIANANRPGRKSYRPAESAVAMEQEFQLHRLHRERREVDEAEMISQELAGISRGTGRHSALGLLAVASLSFHEALIGLAIGLEAHTDRVWFLCVAMATHKLVVSFSAGLEMTWCCNVRRSAIIAYSFASAVVAPAGIVLGVVLTYGRVSAGITTVIVQALAAGTLLYVVFFEVLARRKQPGIWCPLCIVVGFAVMMVLQTTTHPITSHFATSRTYFENK